MLPGRHHHFGTDKQEDTKKLVLKHILNVGLKCNNKYAFEVQELSFTGRIITADGLMPQQSNLQAV